MMRLFIAVMLGVWFLLPLAWAQPGNKDGERVLTLSLWSDGAVVKGTAVREKAAAVTRKGRVDPLGATFRSLETVSPGKDQIWVKAFDSQGKTVFQQIINDPRVLRAEIFDPESGTLLSSDTFSRQGALAQLLLPCDPGIAVIKLFETGAGDPFATLALEDMPAAAPAATFALPVQGVTTLVDSGDSANRVDIVLMGDGYTQSEMAQFADDADEVAAAFFDVEPYKTYKSFFNVHRIDLLSSESGVDHPENNVYKDTALDSGYNCQGIQRLICADETAAFQVASDNLSADAYDIIVVIVNDTEYGGSGGSISVISTHASSADLMLHETGHSFGLLADEYATDNYLCDMSEPTEPNVTTILDKTTAKWAYWIDAATPVPTPESYDSAPGLYEGARYCTTGMYRPTNDSMMRSLGRPFESINEEALIKRIYNYTDPVDAYAPADATVNGDTAQTFSVTSVPQQNSTLAVTWYLDGQSVGQDNTYTLDPAVMTAGDHTLAVQVVDTTSKVKKDTNEVLKQTLYWTVQRSGSPVSASVISIAAGGQTQAVTLDKSQAIDVTISLAANKDKGVQADVWILAQVNSQWYYFNLNTGSWGSGIQSAFQGALDDIASQDILSGVLLPQGVYTIYFGYDLTQNGQVDADVTYEKLDITVQ